MSLSSEAEKLMVECRQAQGARVAAVAEIVGAVEREREQTRAFLQQARATLAGTLDRQLKGVFSEAAFIRGAANDLIERFAAERERKAEQLRTELADCVSQLQEGVAGQLSDLAKVRAGKARRGRAMRTSYFNGLRRSVRTILSDTDKFVSDLNRDRMAAARIWQGHLDNARKSPRGNGKPVTAAAPDPTPSPAPPKKQKERDNSRTNGQKPRSD